MQEKYDKGAGCVFCKSGGTLGEACGCEDVEAEMLCDMSDSACSLQDAADAGSMFETWLVNEFCELGCLQVRPHTACTCEAPLADPGAVL